MSRPEYKHSAGHKRNTGAVTRATGLDYQTIFGEITRRNRGKVLTKDEVFEAIRLEVPSISDRDVEILNGGGYARELRKRGWTPGPEKGTWAAPAKSTTAVVVTTPEPSPVAVEPAPAPEPPAPPVQKPEPVTEYIFCLDASGSMDGARLTEPTRQAFNKQIEAIRAAAVGKVFVTLYSFGSRISLIRNRQPIEQLAPLDYFTAYEGSTRLFDAIAEAIQKAQPSSDAAYVLTVLTDGGDNERRTSTPEVVAKMIKETLATDRWTHAIMLPANQLYIFARNFPMIPAGNIVAWDTTPAGAEKVGEQATQAAKVYMTSRATGATRSTNYFQPNLSAVSEADLAKCTDLSGAFKRYQAVKETTCKEIAEERSHRPFVLGSAYYQLTKREKIQGHKQLLLWHRTTGRIFGGVEARKLIGLQLGVDAKVEPGNHGDFEVYIKSTSINRIVPRGAAMLHDANQVVPDQATWDHEGAKAAAEAKKATVHS